RKYMSQETNNPFPFMRNDPFEDLYARRMGKTQSNQGLVFLLILLAAYLPVLLISYFEGTLTRNATITFTGDFGLQARFLIAVPLLVLSRPVIKMATSTTSLYINDVLLDKDERERAFLPALQKIQAVNHSTSSKVVLIALVVGITTVLYYFTTHSTTLVSVSGWYGYVE